MTTGRIAVGLVMLWWCVSMGMAASAAHAAEKTPGAGGGDASAKLLERMERLEHRVTDLESQVSTLKSEKSAAQENLKHQQEIDAKLQAQLASKTTLATASAEPDDQHHPHPLLSSFGARAGYQGFPFGQKEGGFFYGLFLEHSLVQQNEGMPAGDLDFELGAAVARSGGDNVTVNSVVVGEPTKVEFRQRMISIWPDLKYRFNLLDSYGFTPYLTGGPGIWIDIIETPPLVGGLQFPTPELAARKLPAIAGAGLFEGVQGGAGFEYSLASLNFPILERIKLGFDYRYAAWTGGQRFSTYSLLLSYHDRADR